MQCIFFVLIPFHQLLDMHIMACGCYVPVRRISSVLCWLYLQILLFGAIISCIILQFCSFCFNHNFHQFLQKENQISFQEKVCVIVVHLAISSELTVVSTVFWKVARKSKRTQELEANAQDIVQLMLNLTLQCILSCKSIVEACIILHDDTSVIL